MGNAPEVPGRLSFQDGSSLEYWRHSTAARGMGGEYDEATRRLRCVNCGHLLPLPVHPNGSYGRLNATVLGSFQECKHTVAEVVLEPSDLLLVSTDGAADATNRRGDESGEVRLIDWLMSCRHLHASPLVGKMQWAIRRFSPGEFDDDLTFLAAGSRPLLQRESGKRVGA